MTLVTNARVLMNQNLQNWVSAIPEPGRTIVVDRSENIDPEHVLLEGGILIKMLVLSIDLALKLQMRDPSVPSFMPAFKTGEPIYRYGVGVIMKSEQPDVKVGDHVYGMLPFQEYVVRPNMNGLTILKVVEGVSWSAYVGIAGMPGQVAYYGWKEYSRAKKGDVLFISSGSSSVGSLVIQLGKLDGCKVIASTGSDEKIEYLKSLGADVAFNYKTTNTAEVLAREGPIDIYWDNVGGEVLDAALGNAAHGARFIECGMNSEFEHQGPSMKNLFQIVGKEIQLNGFVLYSLVGKYQEQFYAEIPTMIAEGRIKYVEERTVGMDNAPSAITAVLSGKNVAKSVLIVAED